jgi:hypothetical protein
MNLHTQYQPCHAQQGQIVRQKREVLASADEQRRLALGKNDRAAAVLPPSIAPATHGRASIQTKVERPPPLLLLVKGYRPWQQLDLDANFVTVPWMATEIGIHVVEISKQKCIRVCGA